MTNRPPPSDEPGTDAFLRAALRHAPDRDSAPSAALNARILAAARPSAARRLRAAITAALTSLQRPVPIAAFASLMLATLIGVMWRDGPPPEPRGADVAAPAALPQAASRAAEVPAPATPAPAAAETQAARPGAAAPAAKPAARTRATAPLTPPAPAGAAAPIPSPAAAPAAEPAAVAQAPAAVGSVAAANDSAAPPAERAAERRTREGTAADAARLADAQRQSKQARGAPRAEAVTADPLAALITTAAARADGAAWLAELRRLTQGHWSLGAPIAGTALALPAPDGAVLGRLELDDDAVAWQPTALAGQAWRAPLPAGAGAELRRRLPAWAAPPQQR